METRARYLAIGVFTLTVIAAGFAFVYWLYSGGGFGERTEYQVQFDGPVSGLLVGSGVLFNGIRVGEVTELQLNDDNPKQVLATIEIDPATPVRADTTVSMDFQGLTGAPVVLLTGGSETAPAIARSGDAIPTLVAQPGTGQSMTQAARVTLNRLDDILAENAEPLNAVIENIKKFSAALARNSDKVDNVVAGLERMTGGAAASGKLPIYSLKALRDFKPLDGPKRGQIAIPEPQALMSMSSDKILIARDGSEGASIPNAQWSDNLPVLFQVKVIESFENSDYFQAVGRPFDAFEADNQLLTDLRTFRIETDPKPVATVAFSAKILSKGRILDSKVFEVSVPIDNVEGATAADGLNTAFDQAVRQLVTWAAQTIPPPGAPADSDTGAGEEGPALDEPPGDMDVPPDAP